MSIFEIFKNSLGEFVCCHDNEKYDGSYKNYFEKNNLLFDKFLETYP